MISPAIEFWKNGIAKVKQVVSPVQSRLYIPDVSQTARFVVTKNTNDPITVAMAVLDLEFCNLLPT